MAADYCLDSVEAGADLTKGLPIEHDLVSIKYRRGWFIGINLSFLHSCLEELVCFAALGELLRSWGHVACGQILSAVSTLASKVCEDSKKTLTSLVKGAPKTGRLDFWARIFIFGWTDLYELIQFLRANFWIAQTRDFIFSIQSHVDVYLKPNLCALMYEEGIQSITLTKASF